MITFINGAFHGLETILSLIFLNKESFQKKILKWWLFDVDEKFVDKKDEQVNKAFA